MRIPTKFIFRPPRLFSHGLMFSLPIVTVSRVKLRGTIRALNFEDGNAPK